MSSMEMADVFAIRKVVITADMTMTAAITTST
jgi:hypothetical protein